MRLLCVSAVLVLAGMLSGCNMLFPHMKQVETIDRPRVESEEVQFQTPGPGSTVAVFDTTMGEFRAVLYPAYAPQACANFIGLVQNGYYNGLSFTRVEEGFIVQAGLDAEDNAHTIWQSSYPMEYTDALHHYAGALCAAAGEDGKGASVFYVMTSRPGEIDPALTAQMTEQGWRWPVINTYQESGGAPYLDYTDTVFGQIYEGMHIVDSISLTETDESSRPVQEITIRSVRIEQLGE